MRTNSLDFITDEENVVLLAESLDLGEVTVIRDKDTERTHVCRYKNEGENEGHQYGCTFFLPSPSPPGSLKSLSA